MITNPRSSPDAEACKDWMAAVLARGAEVIIPEITDYEVRRELLRAGKDRGLTRLDALKGLLTYLPVTTPVMLRASEFWAAARRAGRQSAVDTALDADVILAAQAAILGPRDEVVIATTNVRHLVLFAGAKLWREIY